MASYLRNVQTTNYKGRKRQQHYIKGKVRRQCLIPSHNFLSFIYYTYFPFLLLFYYFLRYIYVHTPLTFLFSLNYTSHLVQNKKYTIYHVRLSLSYWKFNIFKRKVLLDFVWCYVFILSFFCNDTFKFIIKTFNLI